MTRLKIRINRNGNVKQVPDSSDFQTSLGGQSLERQMSRSVRSRTTLGLAKNQRDYDKNQRKQREERNKRIATSIANLSGEDSSVLTEGNFTNIIKGTGRNMTTHQLKMLFNPLLAARFLEKQ